jgi:hypothetical protein
MDRHVGSIRNKNSYSASFMDRHVGSIRNKNSYSASFVDRHVGSIRNKNSYSASFVDRHVGSIFVYNIIILVGRFTFIFNKIHDVIICHKPVII